MNISKIGIFMLLCWCLGTNLQDQGAYLTQAETGYLVTGRGKGLLSVEFYPDTNMAQKDNFDEMDCIGNILRNESFDKIINVLNELLLGKWSVIGSENTRGARSLVGKMAFVMGTFNFIESNIRENYIEHEIEKTRTLLREDELDLERLSNIVQNVSIILSGDQTLMRTKICALMAEFQNFKLNQILYNIASSYFQELDVLETRIILKAPDSKVRDLVVRMCKEENGENLEKACEKYFLYSGFKIRSKKMVKNNKDLLGMRYYVEYDVPLLEELSQVYELTAVPLPIKSEGTYFIYEAYKLPKVLGILNSTGAILNLENCIEREDGTRFCDNNVVYENLLDSCPRALITGDSLKGKCNRNIIRSTTDCVFNRDSQSNMVLVGHFFTPQVRYKTEGNFPIHSHKGSYIQNRNVSMLEIKPGVDYFECKHTIFRDKPIMNPENITIHLQDIVKNNGSAVIVHWEVNESEKDILDLQEDLGNLGKKFDDRAAANIKPHWWNLFGSQGFKKSFWISLWCTLITLGLILGFGTKKGRKCIGMIKNLVMGIFKILRRLFGVLMGFFQRRKVISESESKTENISMRETSEESGINKGEKLTRKHSIIL